MGKKHKHSKDKLYQTVGELTSHHSGPNRELELSKLHRRLKFDTCSLSLDTITKKPVGLIDHSGFCYVFEAEKLELFLKKYDVHPITGGKYSSSQLVNLRFHKNSEDQYHCPVIYELFNQFSKIVANKISGHVYSYKAYQKLNLKTNHLKDLLTDEPFEKSDIVIIQDPELADDKWNVSEFHYVKNKLKIDDESSSERSRNIEKSGIVKSALNELRNREDSLADTHLKLFGPTTEQSESTSLNEVNSAKYSDGKLARSVTSTVEPVVVSQTPSLLSRAQIIYPKVKKKGYAQIVTNLGPLNIELYCDRVPKTCHNFLLLASRGYYDGSPFHRLIKNFIVQGGDPTGTGKGGQSVWGQPFEDECHADLKHSGRGILAMANSGPNSNKSQFYIILKGSWDHLDGKHTVFGRVVGGDDTLTRMETVEVDKNDRPKSEVKIINVLKFVDPFEEVERELEESIKPKPIATGDRPLKKFRSGIGAYIDLNSLKQPPGQESAQTIEGRTFARSASGLGDKLASLGPRNGAKKDGKFGDFSIW